MRTVSVTELRKQLPSYLKQAQQGEELLVTSRGRVIARILPSEDMRQSAKAKLQEFRKRCRVGDVVSPIRAEWKAKQ